MSGLTPGTRFDRMSRTAPGSHFGGGHVENRILMSDDDRVWMPTWVWAVIGVLLAIVLGVAVFGEEQGRMPLRVTALSSASPIEPASSLDQRLQSHFAGGAS